LLTVVVTLAAVNAVLACSIVYMFRGFRSELHGLLDYQDRLLDRVQAPEVAAASAAARLSPRRTHGPQRRVVRGRGGIMVTLPPEDAEDDVDVPSG
jgi:hypothetical protein